MSSIRRQHNCSRSAFALLTTMLLLALLVAVTSQLATVTATGAVAASRRNRTLTHELAVDSALLLVADELHPPGGRTSVLIRELDRYGQAQTSYQIGPVGVTCSISDDATRFNPVFFQRPDQEATLIRKLTALGTRRGLPRARVSLSPLAPSPSSDSGALYRWYDQLLADVRPGDLFRWNEDPDDRSPALVWSDVVSFWGDGRIDLRRVDAEVLEVALEDIQPGLAKAMLAARPPDRSLNFLQTALIGVPAEIHGQVAARLTFDARRYALRIDTVVDADKRRWYVVAQIGEDRTDVLHRSRLTW